MPNLIKESVRGLEALTPDDLLFTNREIFLTTEVDSNTANELMKQLMILEKTGDGSEVTLYINSPGGEVSSGLAVYDYMQLMKSPVRTVCIGTAASMAAILFLAGQEDPCVGNGRKFVQELQHMKRVGYKKLTGKMYPGMRHEILNEDCRETVYGDILQWLESRVPASV